MSASIYQQTTYQHDKPRFLRLFYIVYHMFCLHSRIGKPEHRRSPLVFFHPIGLAGTDGVKASTDKSLTVGGIMELLGHKDVSSKIRRLLITLRPIKHSLCFVKDVFKLIVLNDKRRDGITSFAATLITPGPEIGPLGHMIEIHLKHTPMNIQNKNKKSVEIF